VGYLPPKHSNIVSNLEGMVNLLPKSLNQKGIRKKLIKITRGKSDKELTSFTKCPDLASLQSNNIKRKRVSKVSPRF